MQIKDYAVHVKRTMNSELTREELQHNWNFGIIGEFGELVDLLKKHLFHKHELDKDALIKELGDLCWYLTANLIHNDVVEDYSEDIEEPTVFMDTDIISVIYFLNDAISSLIDNGDLFQEVIIIEYIKHICYFYDINFSKILEKNVVKLQKRYQKGFTTEESLKRVDVK